MSFFCLKTTIYIDTFTESSPPCTQIPFFVEPPPLPKTSLILYLKKGRDTRVSWRCQTVKL